MCLTVIDAAHPRGIDAIQFFTVRAFVIFIVSELHKQTLALLL